MADNWHSETLDTLKLGPISWLEHLHFLFFSLATLTSHIYFWEVVYLFYHWLPVKNLKKKEKTTCMRSKNIFGTTFSYEKHSLSFMQNKCWAAKLSNCGDKQTFASHPSPHWAGVLGTTRSDGSEEDSVKTAWDVLTSSVCSGCAVKH